MIIIFWRGYGLIMPVVSIVGFASVNLLTMVITGNPNYYSSHFLPIFFGACLSAAVAHYTAKFLGRWKQPRELIDKRTGEEVILERTDSFMGISARFFPHVIMVVGTLVALGVGISGP